MKLKHYFLLIIILLLTCSLVFLGRWAATWSIYPEWSSAVNQQLIYQLTTLSITLLFLLFLRLFFRQTFLTYFQKGDIKAPIVPVPQVGIKPKDGENWQHLGKNFAIVITLVTSIIIYFQIAHNQPIALAKLLPILPLSIGFALVNSFVEESITRLGVVVVLKGHVSDPFIALISAGIFGTVHYWGHPGGFVGVLAAGFLGWLLAKSILETKGVFWAWLIHFLQDIVILTALLAVA